MASNPLQPSPYSLADIGSELQKHLSYWQATKQLEVLKQLFSKSLLNSHSGNTITRCVCIGVGAFQPQRLWPEQFSKISKEQLQYDVYSALDQMAFLTALLSLLRKRHENLEVYIQDPIYKDAEIAFLRDRLNYTVLQTPQAFDKITTETFVFAPYVAEDLVAEALEKAHPALYIGNNVDERIEKLKKLGPAHSGDVEVGTRSGVPMVDTYQRFGERVDLWPLRVPDARMCWCQGTFIHWRRPLEENASSGS